jgi:hypothetical protein
MLSGGLIPSLLPITARILREGFEIVYTFNWFDKNAPDVIAAKQ